ncbi:MAG: Hsp70 family protein [bacterium]|nr:Hsp70 family protein [bacterium]
MIIGMDFGTTNSGLAYYDGQRLELIPINKTGGAIDRTALYITNDRQVYTGRGAIDTYYAQNLNRPVNIQQVRVGEITLTFAELPSFVRDVYVDQDLFSPGRLFLSFKTALSSLNYVGTVVGSHFYFLEDIIALYIYIAKQQAERHLQTEIKRIVLGRPVRFHFDAEADRLAKERLLKAAFRAGYEEVYLQYEPLACAYHYESTIEREQTVLIFDFGGGTLDISILRVGNPKTRAVLANGGVPIAGDIFDQKLVRAKLPRHFGEGTSYRSGHTLLPVPSSFYEAFSNWQEMLTLQRPDFFEEIKRIEQAAQKPTLIRALRSLVSSSYGLKMYDVVEGVKRELSNATNAMIKLDGPEFHVREIATRNEFERIIRQEIRTIETYLDDLIQQAGLKPDAIDMVIRTGGSSQIPAFVKMLEARFGAAKVRSLEVFSSVTSGLGLIAHQVEQGTVDLQGYRAADFVLEDRIQNGNKSGVPAVDFDVMKKFIALTETESAQQTAALVGLTHDGQVASSLEPEAEHALSSVARVITTPSEDRVLLLTSEYRLLLKTPRQLTRLSALGLELADAEGFQTDIFGDEHVSGIAPWEPLKQVRKLMLLSTSGYFKIFLDTLVARVEQPVPYQVARIKGNPLTMLEARGEIFAFSAAGRVVRIQVEDLDQTDGRLFATGTTDSLIAAFALSTPTDFLVANAEGYVTHLTASEIPMASSLNTNGAKVFTRRSLQSTLPWREGETVHIVSNQRILPLDLDRLHTQKPQKLAKGETLVGMVNLTATAVRLPVQP